MSFGNLQTSLNIINWPFTKNPATLRIKNVIPMIKTNFDRYSRTDTNLVIINALYKRTSLLSTPI